MALGPFLAAGVAHLSLLTSQLALLVAGGPQCDGMPCVSDDIGTLVGVAIVGPLAVLQAAALRATRAAAKLQVLAALPVAALSFPAALDLPGSLATLAAGTSSSALATALWLMVHERGARKAATPA